MTAYRLAWLLHIPKQIATFFAYSLQEEWSNLTSMCNESLNPDQDLTSVKSSKEAIALLSSPETQNHVCQSEPMVLNCFLNNVVSKIQEMKKQDGGCTFTFTVQMYILSRSHRPDYLNLQILKTSLLVYI
jgi:hypothetical protein